jgi:hypothetical protein
MKVQITLSADGMINPANEESMIAMKKLKYGNFYDCSIKLDQNYRLHQKVFGFFAFCTRHYYGDNEAHKSKYNVDYVRGEITKAAGYYEQVFNRTGSFKLVPRSVSYESMPDDEKQDFYKAITDAALRMVFDNTTDENTLNQLMGWF